MDYNGGINMPNVTIYSTPVCPWCKKTKDFLKENKIEYTDFDVSTNTEKRNEMVDKSGQMGVPVLDIDGKIIIGFDVDAIGVEIKDPKPFRQIKS